MDALVLDRYRLDELLGSGGMADVWLATDERSGRRVAVKRLHPHLAADPASTERFRREAAAAAAVDHPNVIKVLDTGPNVIVLEYIHGEALAARIRRGPVERPLVERVGAGLASALAAVHAAGLVHRDVTPGNVLIDETGVAHLGDFGIARPIDISAGVTATVDLMGTWRYVAPEVLSGATATPASDVWSLGATLHEALTGRPPYPADSPAELVEARRRPVPPIDDWPLAALVSQMLDPDPARRPSAAVVSTALAVSPEAVTQILPLPLQGVGTAPEPAPAPVGVARLRPSRPSPPKRAPLRARRAGVAAVGLLVAVGLLAAASAADRTASGSPAPPSPSATLSATSTAQPSMTSSPSPTPTAPGAPGHGHGRGGRGKHGGDG